MHHAPDSPALQPATGGTAGPASLSVVIPVYNSAPILPSLVARLQPVLAAQGGAYELILVNDNSRDNSWDVIRGLCAAHPWIRGVCLMRNFGQHNALLCGWRLARHDILVTMDDDLQHPPEEIPKLLTKLGEGFDVVYGTPEHETHGFLRDMASVITKWALQSTMGAETARKVSAFRAARRELLRAFEHHNGSYVSIDVLCTWGTSRFTAITTRHDPRPIGASNYTLGKLIRHALNMVTGFSDVPLKTASVIGLAFAGWGVLVFIYVSLNYLFRGGGVPGFSFLASIIAIFSGVQLLALGIMGEYLARMHFRIMNKPAYVVRETLER